MTSRNHPLRKWPGTTGLAWTLGLCLLLGSVSAQESGLPPAPPVDAEPTSDDTSPQGPPELTAGTWDISYADTLLGVVTGEAVVTEEGSITVTLWHPQTSQEYVLQAAGSRVEGKERVLILEGESPAGERGTGEELPTEPIRDVAPAGMRFSSGDTQATLAVAERSPSDLDQVEIRLATDDGGNLSGTWSYTADPVTLRDTQGYGRTGQPEQLEDGTWQQVGSETWSKQRMILYGALPVSGAVGSLFSPKDYPFDARWAEDPDDFLGNPYRRRQILVVYGKHLPREKGDEVGIRDDDDTVDYRLYGLLGHRFAGVGPEGIPSSSIRFSFDRAYEEITARLPEAQRAEALELDALLVEATVQEGVVPGWHHFTLNGQSVRWQLLYSNARADVRFVRHLGSGEYQASHDFLLPEALYVEVRVAANTPLDRIPVLIGHNGQVVALDGEPVLMAERVGFDEPPRGVPRPPNAPPPPVLYRTGPIPVGTNLKASPGDKLHGRAVHGGLLADASGLAEAEFFTSPTEPLAGQGVLTWGRGGTLWQGAKAAAAACHEGVSPGDDEDEVVLTLSEFIITEGGSRELPVTLGDHTAMLLLREGFVATMRKKESSLGKARSSAEILGFRSLIRQAARRGNFPLLRQEITAPDGSTQPFRITFDLEAARRRYGLDEAAATSWTIEATRQALQAYHQDVLHSLNKAANTPKCEVEDLLMLTGFGFDAIQHQLEPWLMRPVAGSDGTTSWQVDPIARAHIRTLGLLAEAVKAQKNLSELDTQMALLMASAVAMPGLYFQSAWLGHLVAHGSLTARTGALVSRGISTVGLAVDVADVAQVGFSEIPDYLDQRAEVQFSLGAAAVLGSGRLLVAEHEQKSFTQLAFGLLMGAHGAYGATRQLREAPNVYQYARWGPQYQSMERGAELVERFAKSGVAGMSTRQRRDLLAFLHDADLVRRMTGEGGLSKGQKKALDAFGALARGHGAGDALPAWASGLSRQTLNDLEPLMEREDIHRLMGRDAAAVEALLQGGDRELALLLLRFQPFSNAEQMSRAIREWKQRITEPVDGLYDLTKLSTEDLERMVEIGWTLRLTVPDLYETTFPLYKGTVSNWNPRLGETVQTEFLREWDAPSGLFVFNNALMGNVPGLIANSPIDMIPGRGTPTATFLNLAIMNRAKIPFAGRGENPLKIVKLQTVYNVQTNLHLDWLYRLHGEDIPQEGLRQLFSVRYAESALIQAGYKIDRVRVPVLENPQIHGNSLGTHEKFFRPARGEDVDTFFERFHGPDWRAIPDSFKPIFSPNIFLDVSPIGG